jgi:hypothetical protein
VLNPLDDADAALLTAMRDRLFDGDQDVPEAGMQEWLRRFFDYWAGQNIGESMAEDIRKSFLHAGRKVVLEASALILDQTSLDEYRCVSAPTLLMCGGAESPPPARRIANRLAGAMSRVCLKEFPSAGHLAPITHRNMVNEAIEKHIAHVDSAFESVPRFT